jgi:hypothetical protein
MDQKIEHLWLDRNRLGTAVQLSPIDIEPVTGKQKFHVGTLVATSAADLKK